MKKTIVFIIDGLPGGGAEKVVLTLAEGLVKAGNTVILVSLDKRCDYKIPEGIHYVLSEDEKKKGIFRKITEISRRAEKLYECLNAISERFDTPDLILSNLHKTDRIVSKVKGIEKLNVWYCIHGVFSKSYLADKNIISCLIKKIKIRRVYEGKKIITGSDAVFDDLIGNVKVNISEHRTIYNPFNLREIKDLSMKENPFEGMDYIVHIGRFHDVKRHDRLLEAYSSASITSKLVIVGQGDKEKESAIRNKIKELKLEGRVLLAGFHKNPLPIIKGAKLTVLSSDSEGLPGVIIESLICGTPVVTTRCPGGVREIMSGELSKFTTELNSVSLAAMIASVYKKPYKIKKEMYEKFDTQLIIEDYERLID